MTTLKQLFLNSIHQENQNLHYKSADYDLSFISFKKKIYFILANDKETCLAGTVSQKGNDLDFEFNSKNSSWLKNNTNSEDALQLMEDKYSFMQPAGYKAMKP